MVTIFRTALPIALPTIPYMAKLFWQLPSCLAIYLLAIYEQCWELSFIQRSSKRYYPTKLAINLVSGTRLPLLLFTNKQMQWCVYCSLCLLEKYAIPHNYAWHVIWQTTVRHNKWHCEINYILWCYDSAVQGMHDEKLLSLGLIKSSDFCHTWNPPIHPPIIHSSKGMFIRLIATW